MNYRTDFGSVPVNVSMHRGFHGRPELSLDKLGLEVHDDEMLSVEREFTEATGSD
jgi:hypothetical protein